MLQMNLINEEHGILQIEDIQRICYKIFSQHEVQYCCLFGSYAKKKETEESDVDLIIASPITGLRYFGLIEELRTSLHKRVDLLNTRQLQGNYFLTLDVLNDGIKIYG